MLYVQTFCVLFFHSCFVSLDMSKSYSSNLGVFYSVSKAQHLKGTVSSITDCQLPEYCDRE